MTRFSTWGWQPAIVLASFSPYLMFLALPALVLFVLRRRWVGLGVAVVLTLTLVGLQAPRFTGSSVRSGGPRMSVLQANLGVGHADPVRLVDRVRTENIDLLTTDELTPEALAGLTAAGLDQLLPHRVVAPFAAGGAGTGIWSRYPLTDQQHHEHFASELLSAQLAVGSTSITVFAVHLQPPWPYPPAGWRREIGRLRSLIRGVAGPVLVSGDFNSGLDNAQFRSLLGSGVRDAGEQSGAGALLSYPTDHWPLPPLLPLDHVLVRGVVAASARLVDLPGSDHRALLVNIAFSAPDE